MRIFIGEYLCGGGMLDTPASNISPMLLAEGRAMWRSLVTDVAELTEVVTPIDARLPDLTNDLPESIQFVRMTDEIAPWRRWIDAATDCDAAILIAPETDGYLCQAISMFRAAGIRVLAPACETLRITSDKWLTAKCLADANIATPTSIVATDHEPTHAETKRCRDVMHAHQWIVKPRDGCGGESVRRYNQFELARTELGDSEILQPWVDGQPASVLVMASSAEPNSPSCHLVCPAVWQTLCWHPTGDNEWQVRYEGGHGPAESEMQRRAMALANRVLQSLPGHLEGFLGIDLVLGKDANHDHVVEINPRMTTSYVGLRQMTHDNLAAALFAKLHAPSRFAAETETIRWSADGTIHGTLSNPPASPR